jgi:hypothetical protein
MTYPRAEREHAQQLLSHLAPDQVTAIVRLMEVMLDPLSRKLADAPLEDEEISKEEELAVGKHASGGSTINLSLLEEVLHEFGLATSDFEQMGKTPTTAEANS